MRVIKKDSWASLKTSYKMGLHMSSSLKKGIKKGIKNNANISKMNKKNACFRFSVFFEWFHCTCACIADKIAFIAEVARNTRPRLNIKTVFPDVGISILKIRRSYNGNSSAAKTVFLYWDPPPPPLPQCDGIRCVMFLEYVDGVVLFIFLWDAILGISRLTTAFTVLSSSRSR